MFITTYMNRRVHVATLAAAGLAALVRAPHAAAQTPPVEKIRLAGFESDAMTPLFYAVRRGMFRRAGLEIEFTSMASGAASTAGLVAGTFDMANSSIISACAAHLREVPIVLVAGQVIYTRQNPYGLLQVPIDSTLKTGADLNEKIISVIALNGFNTLATNAWVDKNGGDSRTLKYVEIPFSATEAALVAHRVDAALMVEPQLSTSLAAGTTKTLADAMGAIAPTFMFGCYTAERTWAAQHPETVRKFVRVMTEATNYTNTHPGETAAMMAELTKTPLAVMQKMKRVVASTTLDAGLIQPLIDSAAKYHVIARAFPAKDFFWNEAGK
jgi:NitT/TauT family transport system substrate-binding protein